MIRREPTVVLSVSNEDVHPMKPGRLLAATTLALGALTALGNAQARPAVASCVGWSSLPRLLATAPVVFVGKVVALQDHSTTAIVRVEDVWRGKHIHRRVEVLGSPSRGMVRTDEDRRFRAGVRYLFVPWDASRGVLFQDNACTATQRFTARLNRYRPQSAHRP